MTTRGKHTGTARRKVSGVPARATAQPTHRTRTRRVGQTSPRASALTGSTHITPADGNVFADLGFDPEEARNLTLRADLMIALRRATDDLTQVEAARRLGVAQPRVSELRRGQIGKFTIDTLVNLLARAGIQTRMSLRKTRQPAA